MIVPLIDFVASLDFLSAAEGGRVMDVASGYRPQFHLDGASADCRLQFEEGRGVADRPSLPGECAVDVPREIWRGAQAGRQLHTP